MNYNTLNVRKGQINKVHAAVPVTFQAKQLPMPMLLKDVSMYVRTRTQS